MIRDRAADHPFGQGVGEKDLRFATWTPVLGSDGSSSSVVWPRGQPVSHQQIRSRLLTPGNGWSHQSERPGGSKPTVCVSRRLSIGAPH
jgi:hypothetical protein